MKAVWYAMTSAGSPVVASWPLWRSCTVSILGIGIILVAYYGSVFSNATGQIDASKTNAIRLTTP